MEERAGTKGYLHMCKYGSATCLTCACTDKFLGPLSLPPRCTPSADNRCLSQCSFASTFVRVTFSHNECQQDREECIWSPVICTVGDTGGKVSYSKQHSMARRLVSISQTKTSHVVRQNRVSKQPLAKTLELALFGLHFHVETL